MSQRDYDEAAWAWFLRRARAHNGYHWMDVPTRMAAHLDECGVNIRESALPDVGTMSEFVNTFTENTEVPAVTVTHWVCNCGDYGSREQWRLDLGIPGSYPVGQIISEVIAEAERIDNDQSGTGYSPGGLTADELRALDKLPVVFDTFNNQGAVYAILHTKNVVDDLGVINDRAEAFAAAEASDGVVVERTRDADWRISDSSK